MSRLTAWATQLNESNVSLVRARCISNARIAQDEFASDVLPFATHGWGGNRAIGGYAQVHPPSFSAERATPCAERRSDVLERLEIEGHPRGDGGFVSREELSDIRFNRSSEAGEVGVAAPVEGLILEERRRAARNDFPDNSNPKRERGSAA